jgi:peptidoglycan/LPS O-acetylase OafA/YrhL
VQGLPLPTLLLVAGLLTGFLLAVVTRPFVRESARRKARRARKRLDAAVAEVVRVELLDPLETTRADYSRFCDAVGRAAG